MSGVFLIDRSGRAQDIVGRHMPAITGKFIAASRSANAVQNSASHQCLQHRLKMSWWQTMTRG